MVVERAGAHLLPKPWGVLDLRPWSDARHEDGAIGEIRYERPIVAAESSLLLKLLFTRQPLSIQVHPDDALAHAMGLPRGKTEAWYILSAAPGAQVAVGLNRPLSPQQLREAIDDGSISDLVRWRTVAPADIVVVPAGTIHAIGAGLVIAEIQQRSDTTFRLYDYGRQRELHAEQAIAAADAGLVGQAGLGVLLEADLGADLEVSAEPLAGVRTVLVANAHFVFEKLDLATDSAWRLETERETWLLVVSGSARVGSFDLAPGDAVFAQADCTEIYPGATGMVGLVAYTGASPLPHLLQRDHVPVLLTRAKPAPTGARLEMTK